MTIQVKPNKAFINTRLILFAALFLISGSAGLVYEIVWEKILEQYFGVTMTAITLIVAAYMGGLGLGSLLGGRIARQLKSVFLVYGCIEIGIGGFGLASPYILEWVGKATAGSAYPVVFLLSFGLLLIPTFLMGMTLPLLSQGFVSRVNSSGQVVGLLYGINTIGAAAGSLLAGYILIGFLGLTGAIRIAVVLNLMIGLGAILINRLIPSLPGREMNFQGATPRRTTWNYPTILFVAFLTGFLGLGYEMLWVRILSIINKGTVYNFPTVLTVFLFGLALGGAIWGRRADRVKNPIELFCRLELIAGILAALMITLFWLGMSQPWLASLLHQNFLNYQQPVSPILPKFGYVFSKVALGLNLATYFLPVLAIALPASLIMGGGLPVLDKIAIENPDVAGRRVGDIHLANILGSVGGTLVISFFFLPYLTSEVTLKILVGMSLIFPLLFFANPPRDKKDSSKNLGLLVIAVLSILLMTFSPGAGRLYTQLYQAGTGLHAITRETPETVLALTTSRLNPLVGDLWIGGEINSLFPTNQAWEIPSLICSAASHPRKILIIGLGGGHTANFFSHLPGVEDIVIVELIPDLAPFLEGDLPFTRQVISDPRVHLIADDGRRYLYAHPDETFDLISIDPLRNYTGGHNNLYSAEAQALYRSHLTPGGVLCAWQDEAHILPKTTSMVFSYVDQFDSLAVASSLPLRYDFSAMTQYSQSIQATTGISIDPFRALRGFFRNRQQIISDESASPILTDNRPLLEYYFFRWPITNPVVMQATSQMDFLSRIDHCDLLCLQKLK